ncbi:MAG: hypothetical protein IT359_08595 [Gemmatimonadaceae bacterium]|nr:hypothetical protein [Gemmatimonadaceae bacterium]
MEAARTAVRAAWRGWTAAGRFVAAVAAITVAVTTLASSLAAQAVSPPSPSAQPNGPRRVRLVLSGGASVPTGGFSTYHDLGVQASGSVIVAVLHQKLRLRPELAYMRFSVIEEKVRALAASLARQPVAYASVQPGAARGATRQLQAQALAAPKLPDLNKLGDGAISSLLGTFANLELPLGPRGFQPYLIGGIGAVSFRTDVTTVGEALDGVEWAYNAGAGIRFKLGPLGGGLEARLRQIPVDGSKTFFKSVSAIPVSFSLVF